MADRPWKTKLKGPNGTIIFDVSAGLPESRTASYDNYSLVHMPVDLYAYKNTTSRTFSIHGKLVSRNATEADRNLRYLDLVRSWVLPSFGESGAPPPILKLSSYDNLNIKDTTCVMRSYSWEFPDDVDYIFDGISPMPIIGTLNIELVEIYSANEVLAITPWKIKLGGSLNEPESIDDIDQSQVFNTSPGGDAIEGADSGESNLESVVKSIATETFGQIAQVARNQFSAGSSVGANGVLPSGNISASISAPTSGQVTKTITTGQAINGFNRTSAATGGTGGLIDV